MLSGFRNAAQSKWAIPIIVIIALSFAVWGVSDAFRSGARDAVATVGPEKVTIQEFANAFQARVRELSDQTGDTVTSAQARQAGVDRQILDQLIIFAALDAKAGELNLGVSDERLFGEINAIPAFRDPIRDEFDRESYVRVLAQNNQTVPQFEASLREDLRRQQLVQAIISGDPAPGSYAERRRDFQAETRRATILTLPSMSAADIESPSDQTLQQTLEDNPGVFSLPERRALTIVWFDPARIEQSLEVDEEELQALYEFRQDSFTDPATRTFEQLRFDDQAAAEAAVARLNAGESAQAVADDSGATLVSNDAVTEDNVIDPALRETVFSLGADDPAEAVEGTLGWFVVKVSAAEDPTPPTLEEVRSELRSELAADQAEGILFDGIAAFEDARGAGATLEEAASEAGFVAMSYPLLNRNGQDDEGRFYFRPATARDMLALAFDYQLGEISDLEDVNDGYAVFRVDDIADTRLPELAEIRGDVEAYWRQQNLQTAMRERANDLADRARAGENLNDLAAETGGGAGAISVSLKRGETAGSVGQAMAAAMFEAGPGDVVVAPTANGGFGVARVQEVFLDEQAETATSAEAIRQELSNDLLAQFQEALQRDYDIRQYPDQIALALGDGPEAQQ